MLALETFLFCTRLATKSLCLLSVKNLLDLDQAY